MLVAGLCCGLLLATALDVAAPRRRRCLAALLVAVLLLLAVTGCEPEPEPEPKPPHKPVPLYVRESGAEFMRQRFIAHVRYQRLLDFAAAIHFRRGVEFAAAVERAEAAAERERARRSTPNGTVWDALARCESGGDWGINTGNGYYGGLQFSLSSWQAVGGTGYPHQHSRATQIAMAERLRAAQGWGAWPGCSSKLGLR
jgi:hypothetical protein